MKQLFAVATLACAFLVPANNVWAYCTNNHPAKDLIQTTTKKVLDVLSTNAANTESILEQHVVPHFDWDKMSKWVLGKRKWKRATPQQQARFIKAFKSLLVRTYKTSLKEAAGTTNFKVDYLRMCAADREIRGELISGEQILKKRVTVKARITQGGKKYAVNFKMRKNKAGEWKARNVIVEGISLLLNYKNEFRPLTIEEATDQVKSKNQAANNP